MTEIGDLTEQDWIVLRSIAEMQLALGGSVDGIPLAPARINPDDFVSLRKHVAARAVDACRINPDALNGIPAPALRRYVDADWLNDSADTAYRLPKLEEAGLVECRVMPESGHGYGTAPTTAVLTSTGWSKTPRALRLSGDAEAADRGELTERVAALESALGMVKADARLPADPEVRRWKGWNEMSLHDRIETLANQVVWCMDEIDRLNNQQ